MALVVLAMAVMFRPVSRPAALLLATGLLVANAYVRSRLRGACSLDGARLVARQALVTDIAGAVATYALFLFDPQPTPIAFIPFLVFEFTVRFGARGSATGLVLFFASLGFRMHAQSHFIADLRWSSSGPWWRW